MNDFTVRFFQAQLEVPVSLVMSVLLVQAVCQDSKALVGRPEHLALKDFLVFQDLQAVLERLETPDYLEQLASGAVQAVQALLDLLDYLDSRDPWVKLVLQVTLDYLGHLVYLDTRASQVPRGQQVALGLLG